MQIVFLVFLFALGACLGSFLCCQARRLHLREKGSKPARSICLSCKKQLKWFDNLPLLSWLFLRGKCRYCHHKIGAAELLSELSGAAIFAALGAKFSSEHPAFFATLDPAAAPSPLASAELLLTLLLSVFLLFAALYDGLYGELPTLPLTFSIICAIIVLTLRGWANFSNVLFALLILPGLYFLLYKISRGRWVGDGDWLFALPLALILADPWLALLALTLTNLFAYLFALPSALKLPKKSPRKSQKIHLGPFLLAGFLTVYIFAGFFQSMV